MDKPLNKASIFNTALPVGGANLLAADIKPSLDPGLLRVYVCSGYRRYIIGGQDIRRRDGHRSPQ